jgi:hypothetical protein
MGGANQPFGHVFGAKKYFKEVKNVKYLKYF